ncbi:MAG: U32 family peptidase [Candidatus Omnitrophica bacterium]|nr:U32 family peptidase [Candidatus Omnitrophota bacterium]
MIKNKPELVCPAGDWASLIAAVENGADSIYFGVKGVNMRQMAGNFEISEMKKVVSCLHGHGKKGYLTVNTIVMNNELEKMRQILVEAKREKIDAVILWDLAVLSMAKELKLPIHISTQASVSNIKALEFYAGLGAERVVLARECTLEQIKEIKDQIHNKNIPCSIEVFIHGAMCLSVSGRCFMAYYTHGRSANRGDCTQPCRREYKIVSVDGDEDFIVGRDYVMSPKDLCSIDFIDQLIHAGIDAFKVEGRMRSAEYARVVTHVYRQAIDAHFEGRLNDGLKKEMKGRLREVYNRGFSSGFYFGKPDEAKSGRLGHTYQKIYVGEVKKHYKKISVADVLLRTDGLKKGDEILVIGKTTPACMAVVDEMQQNHVFVDEACKGAHVGIKLPFKTNPKDKVFLWKRK